MNEAAENLTGWSFDEASRMRLMMYLSLCTLLLGRVSKILLQSNENRRSKRFGKLLCISIKGWNEEAFIGQYSPINSGLDHISGAVGVFQRYNKI
jgi:hypothetical protein